MIPFSLLAVVLVVLAVAFPIHGADALSGEASSLNNPTKADSLLNPAS
jgi:hypothetical protein